MTNWKDGLNQRKKKQVNSVMVRLEYDVVEWINTQINTYNISANELVHRLIRAAIKDDTGVTK